MAGASRALTGRRPGSLRVAGNFAATLALGAIAGYVFAIMRTPIPWMLGPMFALAALRLLGVDLRVPPLSREAGQWIIGTSIGLYFTAEVLHLVASAWLLLIAGALFAIACGCISGVALAKLGGFDKTTGIFASIPGGPAEMAVIGDTFGGHPDRIAAGQSLRILIVIGIVPALVTALGMHGSMPFAQATQTVDRAGLALLLGATLAGVLATHRLRVPNAAFLGALVVAIVLTASGVEWSSVPSPVSNAGQWLLGSALGARFQRELLHGGHRFLGAVLLSVGLSIVLSAIFGGMVAWATEFDVGTLLLGTAPGGMSEMCVTAKVLQLGVPLVTALHVTRLVFLLVATPPVFRHARHLYRKRLAES